MNDLATLRSLLARVEAATGPDRDLDHDLSDAFGGVFYQHPAWSVQDYVTAAPMSASIDAALALVEKVLPGWDIDDMRIKPNHRAGGPYCSAALYNAALWTGFATGERSDHELPLAILAALLTALIAQQENAHDRRA